MIQLGSFLRPALTFEDRLLTRESARKLKLRPWLSFLCVFFQSTDIFLWAVGRNESSAKTTMNLLSPSGTPQEAHILVRACVTKRFTTARSKIITIKPIKIHETIGTASGIIIGIHNVLEWMRRKASSTLGRRHFFRPLQRFARRRNVERRPVDGCRRSWGKIKQQ